MSSKTCQRESLCWAMVYIVQKYCCSKVCFLPFWHPQNGLNCIRLYCIINFVKRGIKNLKQEFFLSPSSTCSMKNITCSWYLTVYEANQIMFNSMKLKAPLQAILPLSVKSLGWNLGEHYSTFYHVNIFGGF